MSSDYQRVLADARELHRHLPMATAPLVMFVLCNLGVLALQLPTPFVVSNVVDALATGRSLLDVWPSVVAALLMMSASLWLSAWLQFDGWRQNAEFAQALRMHMYRVLLLRDATGAALDKQSDLHARFSNDVGALVHVWPTGYAFAARQALTIVGAVLALCYVSLPLALCISFFLPLALLIFSRFGRRLTVLAQQAQRDIAQTNGVLLESLAAHELAHALGTAAYHRQRLHDSLKQAQRKLQQAKACASWMGVALGMLPLAITGVIWVVGGKQVLQGALTAGDLVAFALILSILYAPIQGLFSTASALIFEGAALTRIMQIVRMPTQPAPLSAAAAPLDGRPVSIGIRNLNFARDDQPLFKDLSFHVAAGHMAAIRGDNGVGKSTLMWIMLGAHSRLSHHVFLDDKPLAAYQVASRAAAIGYLSQDVMVFSDTLRNNITMGRDVPDGSIWDLAQALDMTEFLRSWPGSLDADIQEGGRNLSGGERQRIGLLRTLVGMPSVLLMDEPEQNLDSQALRGLLSYLTRIKRQCTCILVTHGDAFAHLVDQYVDVTPLHASVV